VAKTEINDVFCKAQLKGVARRLCRVISKVVSGLELFSQIFLIFPNFTISGPTFATPLPQPLRNSGHTLRWEKGRVLHPQFVPTCMLFIILIENPQSE